MPPKKAKRNQDPTDRSTSPTTPERQPRSKKDASTKLPSRTNRAHSEVQPPFPTNVACDKKMPISNVFNATHGQRNGQANSTTTKTDAQTPPTTTGQACDGPGSKDTHHAREGIEVQDKRSSNDRCKSDWQNRGQKGMCKKRTATATNQHTMHPFRKSGGQRGAKSSQ